MKGRDVDADTSPRAYFSLLSPLGYISNRLPQLVWMRLGKLWCTDRQTDGRTHARTHTSAHKHTPLPKVPDPGKVYLIKWTEYHHIQKRWCSWSIHHSLVCFLVAFCNAVHGFDSILNFSFFFLEKHTASYLDFNKRQMVANQSSCMNGSLHYTVTPPQQKSIVFVFQKTRRHIGFSCLYS